MEWWRHCTGELISVAYIVIVAASWTSRLITGEGNTELYPVRLVNGSTIYQGRVEIWKDGIWGSICDAEWDINDAYVVCRQLGYGTAKNATSGTYFPPGNGDYWMDSVQCDGGEAVLAQCPFSGWGVIAGCPSSESSAGVICQEYEQGDAVTVRLEGSSYSFEGRVEVFHSGAWGTICSDNWGLGEAEVACKQLGYEGAQVALDAKLVDGVDLNAPIYLPGLQCQGSETNLAQCVRDGWTDDTCSDYDSNAGVVCLSPDTPEDGDLRLTGGSTHSAGRLEVYHLGIWGTVCDDDWTQSAARVACKQLGYNSVQSAIDHSDYGQGRGAILLDNVYCTGREDKLIQCLHNGWRQHNCDHTEDVAVACQQGPNQTPAPGSSTDNVSMPMSTVIGIITACSLIASCGLMIIRYVHHRQKASLQTQNRVVSVHPQTPTTDLHRYPRNNSGLFIVNGVPIDPNLPPQDLEPPDYSSSQRKPLEVPHEPPPSYEATVADYPDARTDGVSSPVAPDYFQSPSLNVVNILQQPRLQHGEMLPSNRPPYSTPPSSPLTQVD